MEVGDWVLIGVLGVAGFILGYGLALVTVLSRVTSLIKEIQGAVMPLIKLATSGGGQQRPAGGLMGLIGTVLQAKPDILDGILGTRK